jgi:uncharacterized damage-inducible protein DinB
MNRQQIGMLYDYNYWANARVLEATTKVSHEQFTAPARLSHGSLRGTLVHVFGTEVVWRSRCQESLSLPALPTESSLPTLDVLQGQWVEEERKMRGYLASLTDEGLSRTLQYKTTKGVPYENVVWHLLLHVVNHGTQFRGEAAVALTEYGQSPGDLDMLAFFRERGI